MVSLTCMTMLQQYFRLQWTMLKRQLSDFGIRPALGIGLLLAGFSGFSFYLFLKLTVAPWLYMLLALSLVSRLSETGRNTFLRLIFKRADYVRIRLAENGLTVVPFVVFLCCKSVLPVAVLLAVLAPLLSLVRINIPAAVAFPTPFYKRPFEFIVGFRARAGLFVVAYGLTAIAVIYQNFNLGIFSLILVFTVCLSFYNQPEDVFYVWMYRLTPNGFLWHKLKTAMLYAGILSLPVALALLVYFPAHMLITAGFLLLGYVGLLTVLLAKYSSYPQQMNLPQGILLALGLMMPPFLLAIVPFFYTQSVKRLKALLG